MDKIFGIHKGKGARNSSREEVQKFQGESTDDCVKRAFEDEGFEWVVMVDKSGRAYKCEYFLDSMAKQSLKDNELRVSSKQVFKFGKEGEE